jgi:LPXTG-motif cell wall-anchored protein
MLRKFAAVVAIALAALFVNAGAASAEYAPGSAQGQTNRSTVTINRAVVFSYHGGQFRPHTVVTVTVTHGARSVGGGPGSTGLMLAPRTAVVGNIHADAKGNFSTEVKLTEPGLATLTASGADRKGGTLNVVTQVRVLGAGSAAGAGAAALPRTGSDIGTQLWIGAGLLALGGSIVALTVARRRENARA